MTLTMDGDLEGGAPFARPSLAANVASLGGSTLNEALEKEKTLPAKGPGLEEFQEDAEDVIDVADWDAVLAAKLKLVNDAMDHIGWTRYQSLLFLLCGFGYATDSMLIFLPASLITTIMREFPTNGFPRYLTLTTYIGLFVGAILFGLGTDTKGRKCIFNLSLFACSIFTILEGAAPNFPVLALFTALACLGGGGNLRVLTSALWLQTDLGHSVLDTTIYCEWCPSKYQWTITLLALFWGIGQTLATGIVWVFLRNFRCADIGPCLKKDNMGWRYSCYALGALVAIMSIVRLAVFRLHETPKWLVAQGRDDEAIGSLNYIANRYGRKNFLTRGHLRYLGEIEDVRKHNFETGARSILVRFQGLFINRQMTLSTVLLLLLWLLVGIGYPIFNIFLPDFLMSITKKVLSYDQIFANSLYAQICSTIGPMLAGGMCAVPWIGRKKTMAFGAALTGIFMFIWIAVEVPGDSIGFPIAIAISLNLFYGCLYGYTAEVFPAAYRATGTGVVVSLNRIGGIVATLVFVYSSKKKPAVPLYVAGGLFLAATIVCLVLPFEPARKRPV